MFLFEEILERLHKVLDRAVRCSALNRRSFQAAHAAQTSVDFLHKSFVAMKKRFPIQKIVQEDSDAWEWDVFGEMLSVLQWSSHT